MGRRPRHCGRLPLVLLVAGLISSPDTARSQNLSLGTRLGVGNSAALFEDRQAGDRIEPRPGLLFSGLIAYELNPVLAPQLELLLVQRGWKEPGTGGERRLTYIDLPFLLAVHAPWRTAPQLLVGPGVSYELSCAVTGVAVAGDVACGDPRVAWKRAKVLFGLWFGLGLRQRIGGGRLGLQFLGHVSLTDLSREILPRGYIRPFTVTSSVVYQHSLGAP